MSFASLARVYSHLFAAVMSVAASSASVQGVELDRQRPPGTWVYQSNAVVYLVSATAGDTARIGVDLKWGGAVVEVSLNRRNFVNSFDTGRELQIGLWDGAGIYDNCAGCTGVFGWNPVQAGDRYSHGSPVIASQATGDTIYVRTRPYEWFPDNKGGGPNQPVLSDCEIQEWITHVPGRPFAFKVHFRITHFGTDEHTNAVQEFPAVYVNEGYHLLSYYGGQTPWTGEPLSRFVLPGVAQGASPQRYLLYAPEGWASFASESSDVGFTVYVPGQYPYVSGGFTVPGAPGSKGSGTNYYRPFTPYSFGPGTVMDGDVYVIAGSSEGSRRTLYWLRYLDRRDSFTPFGYVDSPTIGSVLGGVVNISGWAIDNDAVSRVDVYLDKHWVGRAAYGFPRADVAREFQGAARNTGFRYELDTGKFRNGTYSLQVRVADGSGNVAAFPRVSIVIDN